MQRPTIQAETIQTGPGVALLQVSGPKVWSTDHSISVNWETGRNANSQAPPQTWGSDIAGQGPAVRAFTGPLGTWTQAAGPQRTPFPGLSFRHPHFTAQSREKVMLRAIA